VVARFEDGAPALVERTVGKGRVLLWASTLDAWWTDLPLDPSYVPLVRQLVTHAARFVPAPPAYTVGQTVEPSAIAGADAPEWIVETPSGRRVRLGGDGLPGVAQLTEPGFYAVRPTSAPVESATPIAANVDPAEADTARIAPAEIARAVVDTVSAPNATTAAPSETRAERESRQSLWRYLLATLLALLVAETLVANRRPRLVAR
jgi:hypothetical protein